MWQCFLMTVFFFIFLESKKSKSMKVRYLRNILALLLFALALTRLVYSDSPTVITVTDITKTRDAVSVSVSLKDASTKTTKFAKILKGASYFGKLLAE